MIIVIKMTMTYVNNPHIIYMWL